MIVMGIDPGFAAFGIAKVEVRPARDGGLDVLALETRVLRTAPSAKKAAVRSSEDLVRRCGELVLGIEAAVQDWKPLALAGETMSWPRDLRAATRVALAWGVIAAIASRYSLPVVQASPQDVKKALVGSKSASKEEIIGAVLARWPHLELPKQTTLHEHAADAAAVVYACRDSQVITMAARIGAAP